MRGVKNLSHIRDAALTIVEAADAFLQEYNNAERSFDEAAFLRIASQSTRMIDRFLADQS